MKTSMGKRLGSLLLTLVFLLGMLPAMEQSARAAITDWASLQAALSEGGTVTLTQNITAAETDGPLTVASGVTVTLDLKGFTVDRGLTSESPVENGGYVIRVDGGSLTLKDTSSGHTGTITGGSNSNSSTAKLGGGVSVYGGTFVMDGGIITGNHGQVSGGGGDRRADEGNRRIGAGTCPAGGVQGGTACPDRGAETGSGAC